MHDERGDRRASRYPTDDLGGRVVDIEPLNVNLGRAERKRRPDLGRLGPRASSTGRVTEGDAIQSVGGRRRFRPELVLLIAGVAFVIGALVKPWPGRVPAAPPVPTHDSPQIAAASQSPALAADSPIPAIAAEPSPSRYPDIPPYDYRWPFFITSPTAAPSVGPADASSLAARWSTVDWSILRTTDPHTGWGFTAALMPSVDNGPNASKPTASWADAGYPPVYAAVPLVRAQSVYAIALTWPSNLDVTSVKFVYLGPPESPPYLPPASFVADSPVTPLPADRDTSPPVSPSVSATIPPWLDPGVTAVRSGEFWIAPSDASPNAVAGSIPAAWQATPWPWPYGAYQVTVTSTSGSTNFIVDLLLTA